MDKSGEANMKKRAEDARARAAEIRKQLPT
jgi:hypothetical protein